MTAKKTATKEERQFVYSYVEELLGRELSVDEKTELSQRLRKLQRKAQEIMAQNLPKMRTCGTCKDKFKSLGDVLSLFLFNKCVFCHKEN